MTDSGGVNTSRRDVLKKAAVAGAVVWTAPVLASSPAFAAGSPASDLCTCQGGKKASITSVTYRWNPGGCGFSTCEPGQEASRRCTGDTTAFTSVRVRAWREGGNNAELSVNGSTGAPGVLISSGGTFTITGSVAPNTRVELYAPDGTGIEGSWVQEIMYHFSCSQPLCFNDVHGSLTVVSYTVTC